MLRSAVPLAKHSAAQTTWLLQRPHGMLHRCRGLCGSGSWHQEHVPRQQPFTHYCLGVGVGGRRL